MQLHHSLVVILPEVDPVSCIESDEPVCHTAHCACNILIGTMCVETLQWNQKCLIKNVKGWITLHFPAQAKNN
jgi:hypothetical protein